MRNASWVSFVLGLWLIAVPFVFRSPSSAVIANDVILGILIALFSVWVAQLWEPPVLVSWILTFFGAWMIVAAFTFRANSQPVPPFTNELVVGIVVAVVGFLRAVGVGIGVRE